MAKFNRSSVSAKLRESAVVPVYYVSDSSLAFNIASACYAGGIRAIEFTNRGDGAHLVFQDLVERIRAELPELAVGIGSVIDAGTASLFLQMGADFVVSPALVEEMASVCNRRKVLWVPGCGTVSEIVRAHELGAEVIKIFPGAEVGGPNFVKAILGPMPWTLIMPTGGVSTDEANLKAWFSSGVHCVGIGSNLITNKVIADFNHDALKLQVEQVMKLIQKFRTQ